MRKSIGLIFILLITLFSCSKKEEEDVIVPDVGKDYAGLEVGKYVIYDVDSFFHDDFTGTIDTSYYQIKEVVDSKFDDLEGEEAFKIIRYRKEIDSTQWILIDVWSSKLTQTNFQKTEENIKYVKLIFPVGVNKTWNGNSMNNLGNLQYEYTVIDNSESIGGNSLKLVLRVLQLENLNLIDQELFEEKYAKGIGMVYKKSMDLNRSSLSAPWSGIDITMTLSSYGG